jgi:hypothetical protein
MSLDLHAIFTFMLGIGLAVLGWLARELWDAVKSLRKDLASLEVRITRDYVSYDRLQDAMRPVMDALHEIKNTLKEKADK